MSRSPRVSALAVAYLIPCSIVAPATAAAPDGSTAAQPLTYLSGRWAGEANVVPASGPSEAFKCVVVYRQLEDGASLKQTLRCSSGDYKLEAATHLRIDGDRVSGSWEDKINAMSGEVSGVLTKTGFEIQLSGRWFAAGMTVTGDSCAQLVRLVPVKADYIKELSASLRRC